MERMKENYDLAKWLAGEMSGEELETFEKSAEYATYAKIKDYSAQLNPPAFDEKAMYGRVISHQKKLPKVLPLYKTLLRVAAVLVIALGLFFVAKNMMPVTQSAANGQIASFELPDRSEVVLNAGSEIEYKKWGWANNRTLELNGQAYFKVAKGQKFEVNTSLGKVTVLGTQFDVKARDNRFDVSCFEGRVRVDYGGTQTVITKGQSVSFDNGQPIDVPQNNNVAPAWLSNQLVFNKETLQRIIGELGRQYDITIEMKAPQSGQLFTGVLPMKNLDEALQIVGAAYHLKPVRQNGKIILESL
jgi:ferric-dicitrate binding protein FerR (iron transport regulator)